MMPGFFALDKDFSRNPIINGNNLRDNRENVSGKSELFLSNFNSSSINKEYNSIPSDRFYTEKEEITLRFYQTPKALLKILNIKAYLWPKAYVFNIKRQIRSFNKK